MLFQNNWVPLFIAGTGDATLEMPEGSGHILTKGTQLNLQLHLLNAKAEAVTETVPIRMRKMDELPPNPTEVVVFGSVGISLPPNQPSQVVSNCASDSDMKLFSAFPHMHLLGRSLVVEAGPSDDAMTKIFRRDPYDFDAQTLSDIDVTIHQGDKVRVTCVYDNYLDHTVTFGESTTNEMCFFIGFATGASHPLAGCIGQTSGGGGFIPAACGTDPANDIGLGETCSAGGGECSEGLICTEDIEQVAGPEVCIGFGCGSSADCGEGGVCCKVAAAGGASLCLPPSCVFAGCSVVE